MNTPQYTKATPRPPSRQSDPIWHDPFLPSTYLNLLYLFFNFPLGIMYFVVLLTLLALGFGLSITLLGIPILIGTVGLVWGFAWLERKMAAAVLGSGLGSRVLGNTPVRLEFESQPKQNPKQNQWTRLRGYLRSPQFWSSFGYLWLKFPLGIASFVVAVTLLSVSVALLGAPVFYLLSSLESLGCSSLWFVRAFSDFQSCSPDYWGISIDGWQPNFAESFALFPIGLGITVISLRVLNLFAQWQARLALWMLGQPSPTLEGNLSDPQNAPDKG
jgi:hypothetical protein